MIGLVAACSSPKLHDKGFLFASASPELQDIICTALRCMRTSSMAVDWRGSWLVLPA